ncbi:O-antigen ligase family protein [Arthrobacter sp. H-02-3]|uniref:O-antigen ligase family protein n=1 Tax=Arthrobacter sp. H-02-3 TaxID=2703675 RepID=UPI001379FC6D|nr:O-antigen ligase family protein [Arthrobacter sp. H-02-3]
MTIAVLFGILSPAGAQIPRPLKFLFTVCGAWILASALASENPAASIAGRWPRYEGVLTISLYLAIFIVGAKLLGGNSSRHRWMTLRRSLAVVSVPLFAVSALEAAGLRPLGGGADDRPGATLGNATDQGIIGFIIAGLLCTPSLSERGWMLWLRRAGLACGSAVAVLSGSRAAIAGLTLVILYSAAVRMKARSWSGVRTAAGVALITAALASAVFVVPGTRDRLFSGGTVDGRFLLWGRSLDLIKDHTLYGVGPSGFVDSLPAYLNEEWARTVGDSYPVDSPHNWLLQASAAGGLPLLLLVLASVALCAWTVRGRLRETDDPVLQRYLKVSLVAVTAYGLALLTHFTSIGTTGLVAFICGGLMGRENPLAAQAGASTPTRKYSSPHLRQRFPRIGALALAAACLVVIIPAMIAELPMSTGVKAARTGDASTAEQSFQFARALRPWDSDTSLLAAQAFAERATTGDAPAAQHAIEWGRIAQNQTPHSQEAGLALAIGYIYSGQLENGKDLLDTLLSEAPSSTGLYVQRGLASFGLGRTAESIDDLERAASLDPKLDTPWRILAGIYQRLGDLRAAQTALEHAETLTPR